MTTKEISDEARLRFVIAHLRGLQFHLQESPFAKQASFQFLRLEINKALPTAEVMLEAIETMKSKR